MPSTSPAMLPDRSFSVLKRLRLTLDCVCAHMPVNPAVIPAMTSNATSAGRRCAFSSVSRIQAIGREP